MRSRLRRLTKQRRARQWHQLPRRWRQAPCPARRRTERRQGSRQQRLIQHSSRQPGAPIRKGFGSFGINAEYPRGIGPNYGDLMPAPDRIQAAVFTVLQTSRRKMERATSRPIAEIRIRIGGAIEAIWQRIAHAIATLETARPRMVARQAFQMLKGYEWSARHMNQ